MLYFYIKALHIIFVVTWFAGLFYTPRLMVYAIEAARDTNPVVRETLLKQLLLMQRRLWLGITTPSAVLTLVTGTFLVFQQYYPDLPTWLWVKIGFVAILYVYHIVTHILHNEQRVEYFRWSSDKMRLWNEVPTFLLFAIVFQVILKNSFSYKNLVTVFVVLSLLIYVGFVVYKKYRKKQDK